MQKYYIYGLFLMDSPEDIRYIGITGRSTKQRLVQHLSDAKRLKEGRTKHKNCYRTNWLSANQDKVNICVIAELESKEEAAIQEVYYIKGYAELGYKLTNTTYGPSNYKSGYTVSDAARANIRAGRNRPEVQARMREVNLGRVVSPEQRAKIAATLTGRTGTPKTDAEKLALSQRMLGNTNGTALKGRKRRPEVVARMAAAMTGVKQSAETVAKRVAANTGLVRKTYRGVEKDFSVNQYSLNGAHIKTWPMVKSIQRELNIQGANIYKVLKGERTQAGGFFWKRKETLATT